MTHVDAPLRLAVLGCGVVGTEVVRRLLAQDNDLGTRAGIPLELIGVGVRTLDRPRDPAVPTELLTTDLQGLVDGADVVVELLGGISPAKELLLRALHRGAAVVTANKALVASHATELHEAADAASTSLLYEAAVAGAVPVVRGVRESLAGDAISRVLGVVNGTTNFILDRMSTTGADFASALAQARDLGYAEADPTADVEGLDAGAKAAILATLAFHTRVRADDVPTEGITAITPEDVVSAAATGHVIKLLAIAEQTPDGVAARVHPALVPADHPLAAVRGAFNAVVVEAEAAGTLMFYGQGAGGAPTASAVLGDVIAAARARVAGGQPPAQAAGDLVPLADPGIVRTRLQIRLDVSDRPGVLADIAALVARHGVSIETVHQADVDPDPDPASPPAMSASLVITTHIAPAAALSATVADLAELDTVLGVVSTLRVEGH